MKLSVHNARGEESGTIEVDERVFGIKPNRAVMHQALLAHLASRRAGTASTKTRGEVRGSTAKLRIQKGIGRARIGSVGAPNLRHGGVAFGPRPRSYAQRLPKRMRRLAVRSVLSQKVTQERLRVVDAFTLDRPRTKDVLAVLEALGFRGSTLIVHGRPDRILSLGARNIPETKTMSAAYLNVVDLLSYRGLLMTVEAVRTVERLWGGERVGRRRAPIPPEAEAPEVAMAAKPKRATAKATRKRAETPAAAASRRASGEKTATERAAPAKRATRRKTTETSES